MSNQATADASRADALPRQGDLIPVASNSATPGLRAEAVRSGLRARGAGGFADGVFRWAMLLCALSLPAIALVVLVTLAVHVGPSVRHSGWSFLWHNAWNPVSGDFGALAFLFGTAASSLLALLIAAPGALAVAVFVVEICPRALRTPIAFVTDLLAAVPSVVYGLWALLFLVPFMREHFGPALSRTLGWTGLFRAPNYGVGVLTAALVLALMVFPVISAVSREVMQAVPVDQREAALALGATRWEMIRTGVLRNARLGLAGALLLGLGRALGETMAVAMVIGNHPAIAHNLLAPGYTLGSVIANEFAEAESELHLSALMELGLVLFAVTTLVNALARLLVWLVRREFLQGVHA